MIQLCSRCKSELVEFYPDEEHFNSIKEYTVYCDECKIELEEERINELHERGCVDGVHYDSMDLDF